MTATPTPGADAQRQNDAPLRVALFSGNYNFVMDGAARAQNMLVGHLLERGHEVLVFAPTTKTPAFRHQGEIVSIPSVPLPGNRGEYRLGLGLFGAARGRLEALAPDIVHIAAPDYTGYSALKWAEKNGAAPVASFHTRFDTYPRYYGAKWLEKHVTNYMRGFYGRCEHVYAPSLSMADELARDRIGRDVRLWTRGVDGALFNPAHRDMAWRREQGFSDDDVVVAFVGRVVLEKGIDVFAEAVVLAAERNPKIRALIVGGGPELARFKAHLPTAVFTGHAAGADLSRGYASADIFFNPSVTEAFGNVTLEAMASGLPCVCAAASGALSLVEDGVTGLLSPPEAGAAGYAEKLLALAGDDAFRRRCGDTALARSGAYSWPAILDGLIDQYREAITNRAARRLAA